MAWVKVVPAQDRNDIDVRTVSLLGDGVALYEVNDRWVASKSTNPHNADARLAEFNEEKYQPYSGLQDRAS